MLERDKKWKAVDAFEKARKGAVTYLQPPAHRGLMASVKPREGAEAVVSYKVVDTAGSFGVDETAGRVVHAAHQEVFVVEDSGPAAA